MKSNLNIEKYYIENRRKLIGRITNRVGSNVEAEDILHDAFVKALSAKTFCEVKELDRWFNTIITNVINDYFTSGKKTSDIIIDVKNICSKALDKKSNVESIAISKEQLGTVDSIIKEYSRPVSRRILYMFLVEGHSVKQIVAKLGVTEPSIWNLIKRFRRELNGRIKRT